MEHPTAREPPVGLVSLDDASVPAFLDANRVAVLLFVDGGDPASLTLRERAERVALKFVDRAAFGELDVRRHPFVADAIGMRSVPAVVVFRRGRSVDEILGVAPESILEQAVRGALGIPSGPPIPMDDETTGV